VGARFFAPLQTGPGAHPVSYTMSTGSFPKEKRPGLGVDHPPSSSAEAKGSLELYIYIYIYYKNKINGNVGEPHRG